MSVNSKKHPEGPSQPPALVDDLFAKALRHHQEKQLPEAESLYRQVLTYYPQHADSLHLLGMIGYQCGQLEPAEQLIVQAILVRPDEALYHSNLGVVLNSLGQLDRAVRSYEQALALRPGYTEAHCNLANALVAQGKYADAVPHFERALALDPSNFNTYLNLGVALAEQGDMAAAISNYERAITLNPESTDAFSNLGNALHARGRLEDAVRCFQRALALKPDNLTALYNLGNTYQGQDKLEEAFQTYDTALAFRPDYLQALYGKSLGQLLEGNFVDGWQNYENRWKVNGNKPMRPYSYRRWKGDKLASGQLLIWGEQGVGDEILFAGLIPDVLRTGSDCVLDCDARLAPLFTRSFPRVRVVSGFTAEQYPDLNISAHLPAGSLPRLFRTTQGAFNATTSAYLVADGTRRDELKARYACGKRVVGVAWHTKNAKTGHSRCVDLTLLAPLMERKDIFWVSLQYGNHDELETHLAAAKAPIFVDRTVDQLADMDVFAAQVAAMDLVITIDNSTAHVAGALGVPVWILLPFDRDWRWLQTRPDSPWYPSARLFRQAKNGDWPPVIEAMASAMANEP